MGLFRKSASVLTAGLIDFRSDKERIARYTRQTRNASRDVARLQHATLSRTAATYAAAPGWYPDPAGAPCARWWDGRQWTPATR